MAGYWYVIHIYSGHEKKVKVNLDQRIQAVGLQEEILEVVVPMKEVVEVKDGKRRVSERPSYPGYILVKTAGQLSADAESEPTRQSWNVIKETPGVMSFLGASGSAPSAISEAEVQNILEISTDEEEPQPVPEVDYAIGDKVKVIDGPFNGFPAEVKGIDNERQRLDLMIKIFGRTTPIEIEFLGVEKL